MNLQAIINFYNYYTKYLWSATDFLNLQNAILNTIALISGGNPQIVSGLQTSAGGGMNLSIASGVCVNSFGTYMYIPTAQTVTIATPVGNPAISLVVARPLVIQNNNIPEPTAPATNVPLWQQQSFQLVVLNGAPSATPVAPTPLSTDVVISEISLTSGQSSITSTSFLFDLINRTTKRASRITLISANYSATGAEDIIEGNCAGGAVTVTLPLASTVPGLSIRLVKTDSSANSLIIAASGSDAISGQTTQTLDDQWSKAFIYSSGQSWRMG